MVLSKKLINPKYKNIRISVLTAVLNGDKYLEHSIKSVIKQTHPNIEYIIIDGGSTDDTVEILKKYSNRLTYWISESDCGIYDAWNKGLKVATGEWVCWLGSDDFFLQSDAVEKMIPYLYTSKKRYIYNKINLVCPHNLSVIEEIGDKYSIHKHQFSKLMTLVHCGSFQHKSLFKTHGNYDTCFKIAGDYEYLLREYCINKDFAFFVGVPPIVAMRFGGISNPKNPKDILLQIKEMNLARKKNNIKGFSVPLIKLQFKLQIYFLICTIFSRKTANYLLDWYRFLQGKPKKFTLYY